MIFRVTDNIVISEVKPFINVSSNQVDELTKVVDEYIEDGFGFISTRLRESEISIDPTVWIYVFDKLPNIKSFALVTDSLVGKENFVGLEKPVIESLREGFHADVFPGVEEAYKWMKKQL